MNSIVVSAWRALFILACLFILGIGVQAAGDTVEFFYQKVERPKVLPELYTIYVKVNDEDAPLIHVKKVNVDFTAETRAKIITGRLQKAWDCLPDKEKLSGIIQIIRNTKFKVYVLAPQPENPIAGMPDTIMQLDNTDTSNLANDESPMSLLRQIRFAICSALRGDDLSTKAPISKQLDDQKTLSATRLDEAMLLEKTDTATARDTYIEAIGYNPENMDAYRSLQVLTEKSDAAFSKEVKDTLANKVTSANKLRQEGDDAYDAQDLDGDKTGYSKALDCYTKASAIFPECASYYWLRSMVLVRMSGLKVNDKPLDDAINDWYTKRLNPADGIKNAKITVADGAKVDEAISVLTTVLKTKQGNIITGLPGVTGPWYTMFNARAELLSALKAHVK